MIIYVNLFDLIGLGVLFVALLGVIFIHVYAEMKKNKGGKNK